MYAYLLSSMKPQTTKNCPKTKTGHVSTWPAVLYLVGCTLFTGCHHRQAAVAEGVGCDVGRNLIVATNPVGNSARLDLLRTVGEALAGLAVPLSQASAFAGHEPNGHNQQQVYVLHSCLSE